MSQVIVTPKHGSKCFQVDATGGDETVTLPTWPLRASGVPGYMSGECTVIRVDSSVHTVTVRPPTGWTLNGAVDGTSMVPAATSTTFSLVGHQVWAGGAGTEDGVIGTSDLTSGVQASLAAADAALPAASANKRMLVPESVSTTLTTLALTVGHLARIDCTAGSALRSLPSAASAGAGGQVGARQTDTGTNTVTIAPTGSDTINGVAGTRVMRSPERALTLLSDGVGNWSVAGTDTPTTALDATYAPWASGAKLVVTGTSLTARNSGITSGGGQLMGDSWATHLALLSSGSLQLASNAGHGGYSSTQLLALFDAEVMASSPKVVGIEVGRNDGLDGSSRPTQTATNIKAMVAKARAGGAAVFICTVPPQGCPALGTPAAPTVTTSTSGGTLGVDTYSYRVAALNLIGTTLASSATAVGPTSGSTSSNTIVAPFTEGATSYKLYGRTAGTETLIATNTITGQMSVPSQVFVDTGSVTPSGAVPGSNTSAVASIAASRLATVTINAWIRRYCAAQGIPCVDLYDSMVDPTTGTYKLGYTIDGVHPSPTSSRRWGTTAWAALSSRLPSGLSPLTADNSDPLDLWPNSCNLTGGGSLPTGWNSNGGTGANFTDTNGAKSGFVGNAFTAALTAPDARNHSAAQVVSFSGGDRLWVAVRVQTETCEAGGGLVDLQMYNFAQSQVLAELYLSAADVSGIWITEVVMPAIAGFGFKFNQALGACSGSIGQITVYNMTTGAFITP